MIRETIERMNLAGFHVIWIEAKGGTGRPHTFHAMRYATGQTWTVHGEDPLDAVIELQMTCGFTNAD